MKAKRRKVDKQIRKLKQRIKALESARMWEPLGSVEITGPEFDPHALLAECVDSWQHGYDDDEDWSTRGYL